jgi:hypothetical protein
LQHVYFRGSEGSLRIISFEIIILRWLCPQILLFQYYFLKIYWLKRLDFLILRLKLNCKTNLGVIGEHILFIFEQISIQIFFCWLMFLFSFSMFHFSSFYFLFFIFHLLYFRFTNFHFSFSIFYLPYSVFYKNVKVIRKSASFLVKFDLKPHQTFVILLFHFPC